MVSSSRVWVLNREGGLRITFLLISGGGRKSEKRKTIERQLVCVFRVHYCHDNEAHLLKNREYTRSREDVPMSGLENADLFMFVVAVAARADAASFTWVSDYTAIASEGGRR